MFAVKYQQVERHMVLLGIGVDAKVTMATLGMTQHSHLIICQHRHCPLPHPCRVRLPVDPLLNKRINFYNEEKVWGEDTPMQQPDHP